MHSLFRNCMNETTLTLRRNERQTDEEKWLCLTTLIQDLLLLQLADVNTPKCMRILVRARLTPSDTFPTLFSSNEILLQPSTWLRVKCASAVTRHLLSLVSNYTCRIFACASIIVGFYDKQTPSHPLCLLLRTL